MSSTPWRYWILQQFLCSKQWEKMVQVSISKWWVLVSLLATGSRVPSEKWCSYLTRGGASQKYQSEKHNLNHGSYDIDEMRRLQCFWLKWEDTIMIFRGTKWNFFLIVHNVFDKNNDGGVHNQQCLSLRRMDNLMDVATRFLRGCGGLHMKDESVYNILRYLKDSIPVFYGVATFVKQILD